MRIVLKDKYKKRTITREDGEQINKMINDLWNKEETITIGFSKVLIASVSFLDEAFGKLAFDYPKEVLTKKLSFENLEEYDRALLNDILLSRYHQKELGENGVSRPTKKKIN
ncbi:STAS-like domain-containing protein [bacterium]|nr:STAS-like domain-containing protein [bacterium]